MLKVYGPVQSRAARVMILLEELGLPYDHISLDLRQGEHRSEDYRKIHPLRQVPALQDGNQILFESVAICLQLSDQHPGLAPTLGSPARGEYYQWCTFLIGSFEPALFANLSARSQDETAQQKAAARLSEVLGVIRNALEGRQYLVGESYTTADLLIGSGLSWATMMGLYQPEGHLGEYLHRITSRPAFQKVMGGV